MDRNQQVIILKGIAQQILSMAMPTIEEANKLFNSFGVEIVNLRDAKEEEDIEEEPEPELYDSIFVPKDSERHSYLLNAKAFYEESKSLLSEETKAEKLSYALHFYRLALLNVERTTQLPFIKSSDTQDGVILWLESWREEL